MSGEWGNQQNMYAHSNLDAQIAAAEAEVVRLKNLQSHLWHNRFYQGQVTTQESYKNMIQQQIQNYNGPLPWF